MSLVVWLVTYFGLYFGVMERAFGQPEGFLDVLGMVAVCWVISTLVQGIFDAVTGRS